MLVGVRYHPAVHTYQAGRGQCGPRCMACMLERGVHRSEDEAVAAQPAKLVADRRFEVVVVDQFGGVGEECARHNPASGEGAGTAVKKEG